MWEIVSPSGKRRLKIALDSKGALEYEVYSGALNCVFGLLGLRTSLGSFCEGLVLTSIGTVEQISEEYSIPAGKKELYSNTYVQEKLFFKKNGIAITLETRVYDDGIAFRYALPKTELDETAEIEEEFTDFRFTEETGNIWLQELVPTYEAPYIKRNWSMELNEQHYAMPALARVGENGPWIMLNEAGVLNHNGDYCVSHLTGTSGHMLRLAFALEEHGRAMHVNLPFETPWRYILVADTLNDVMCSTLNYNLNPPAIVDDVSWIKPARALWQWWINDTGPQVYSEAVEYVDFAAAMGFEAVVVDAGWDSSWIERFCQYAHSKGISPWLWTAMIDISTKEKAEEKLAQWKCWGIDGVKIDCIENDSANTAGWYQMVAEIMARERLMVNFHGCTKPMGEGRTWPHFVAAEGIMGLEYYKWSDQPDAAHNCTVPFIRNAVGPMDYTPVGLSNKNRNTSMAHQMALAAVFESGYTHYAASIYNLEAWKGTDFLRRLSPKYDGLRLLSGYPGDHVAILRWKREPEEYVIGCICNTKRTLQISLDFLGTGEYEAELYLDDRFGERIIFDKKLVSRKTILTVPMILHGGAGIYISKAIPTLQNRNPSGYMFEPSMEKTSREMRAVLGSMHRSLSDEDSTSVLELGGGAYIACEENFSPGMASVRLFYRSTQETVIRISDGISEVRKRIPASGETPILSTHSIDFHFSGGPVNLLLEQLQGEALLLEKVQIIENHPPIKKKIFAETASIQGNGNILRDAKGGYKIVGVDQGTTIHFADILVPEAGEYLITIGYYAGPTGTAWLYVNGGEGINAKLNGVGKWNSTKDGDYIKREVLAVLKKGFNSIDITAQEPLPTIKELVLMKLSEFEGANDDVS